MRRQAALSEHDIGRAFKVCLSQHRRHCDEKPQHHLARIVLEQGAEPPGGPATSDAQTADELLEDCLIVATYLHSSTRAVIAIEQEEEERHDCRVHG